MFARLALAFALAAVPCAAAAQVIPPTAQPGREREQLNVRTTPPLAQPGGGSIRLPSTGAPAGADKIMLVVRRVEIVGSTVYRPEDLAALYQDMLGQRITLQAVYELAQRITTKYGADGYVLSRAIVPPQELSPHGAVVRIRVVEGYIDKVESSPTGR
jgi:hemolysin activation/secretion protein